jgi:ATP-binding protein involved in chromosome partitioning
VPLLGKVPLTMPLREHADAGLPLVLDDPDDPAAQAIRQAARGLIALMPVELPMMAAPAAPAAPAASASPIEVIPPTAKKPSGMSLPMAG